MNFNNPHAKIDEENREREVRLAGLIRGDSEVIIGLARLNLREWGKRWGGLTPACEEWDQLLRVLSPGQIADFLESTTPMANRLRQSSPFLRVIEKLERNGSKPIHAA